MNSILVVDDDVGVQESLRRLLELEGYLVSTAASGEEALLRLEASAPDLMLIDIRMGGIDGLETCRRSKMLRPDLPVIVMTACGTTDTAIGAMKSGAFDYLLKPFNIPELLNVIDRAANSRGVSAAWNEEAPVWSVEYQARLVGASPKMVDVYKRIGQVAALNVTVLLQGESGTGKELLARAIWAHSPRSTKPFVAVSCAALPESLLESELFGSEKGAFTGSIARRQGRFEQANGGTIFLDEIGDLTPGIQVKLLRVLQERSFERLGASQSVKVDVRVIAATHRDLHDLVRRGRFREDLYYRLKVVTISAPPLRDRLEDLAVLSQYFLQRHAVTLKKPNLRLGPGALDILKSYSWPGNVRELEHCLVQAGVVSSTGVILPEHLSLNPSLDRTHPVELGRAQATLVAMARDHLAVTPGAAYERLISQVECALVTEAMAQTQGNQAAAARLLGISRPTLREKLRACSVIGLAPPESGPDLAANR